MGKHQLLVPDFPLKKRMCQFPLLYVWLWLRTGMWQEEILFTKVLCTACAPVDMLACPCVACSASRTPRWLSDSRRDRHCHVLNAEGACSGQERLYTLNGGKGTTRRYFITIVEPWSTWSRSSLNDAIASSIHSMPNFSGAWRMVKEAIRLTRTSNGSNSLLHLSVEVSFWVCLRWIITWCCSELYLSMTFPVGFALSLQALTVFYGLLEEEGEIGS